MFISYSIGCKYFPVEKAGSVTIHQHQSSGKEEEDAHRQMRQNWKGISAVGMSVGVGVLIV